MGGLALANPLLALGLIGVAAPIIIHFFFRRRAKHIEFSAMRFVILSYKKIARKLLLYEYLLLIARCLMVALLALAIAGPLYSRVIQGIQRGERPLAVVFVLDTSLSMTRMKGDQTLFDYTKSLVSDWLGGLAKGDRIEMVDAVRLSGSEMVSDPDEARERLDDMETAFARARMTEAISLAASRVSALQDVDKMIVVFTDLQRSSWAGGVQAKTDLPPVYVVDVAEGMEPKNLSVSGLEINWKSLAREEAAQIRVKVFNHGSKDIRQALLRVEFGDEVLAQGFVDVKAGEAADKEFVLTEVPPGEGMVRIQADDGLAGDNAAYFHLKGGHEVRALVVDGDPGTGYLESETFFLDQALNPRLYARSRVSPRAAAVAEIKSVELSDFSVVVLANVDKPGPEAVERIKEFVKNGGGLLLTLGDRVDADLYNGIWGDLLPRELRGAKLAYAGARGSSEVRVMHLEMPGADSLVHPLLSIFRDPAQGDLGLSGFWKYFLMQQEIVPSSKVILRLTNGVPIMVEGRYGRGKVIMFASTADRAWNDFCIHPTFLPLFQQTVQYLGNALVTEDVGKLVTGSVVEIPVASDVIGALVMGPDRETSAAELIEEKGARRIRIGATEVPGTYFIKLERQGENDRSRFEPTDADRTIVLNIDPAESDLSRTTEDEIKARIRSNLVRVVGPDAPLDPDAPRTMDTTAYAGILLWLLVGFLVLERVLIRKG